MIKLIGTLRVKCYPGHGATHKFKLILKDNCQLKNFIKLIIDQHWTDLWFYKKLFYKYAKLCYKNICQFNQCKLRKNENVFKLFNEVSKLI